MLNLIKMDLYRMFSMASFYVIICLFSIECVLMVYSSTMESDPLYLSIADLIMTTTSTPFITLFTGIFSALFLIADKSSQFIKNYGGQLKHRCSRIFSKIICIIIYNILFSAITILLLIVSDKIFKTNLELGFDADFFRYYALAFLGNIACCIVIVLISTLFKSTVPVVILPILISTSVFSIIFSGVDNILHRIGIDFSTQKYMLSENLYNLPWLEGTDNISFFVLLFLGYAVISAILSCIIFKKKDIA
mgnify:FL=1